MFSKQSRLSIDLDSIAKGVTTMALIHYRPLFDLASNFRSLEDELNRIFTEVSPAHDAGFVPAAELSETPENLELRLELPGIKKEDLNVEVMADSVRISGDRKSTTHVNNQGFKRSEFRYGSFERVIGLPMEVVNTDVQAHYEDGILTLTLPKRIDEGKKPYKVQL